MSHTSCRNDIQPNYPSVGHADDRFDKGGLIWAYASRIKGVAFVFVPGESILEDIVLVYIG